MNDPVPRARGALGYALEFSEENNFNKFFHYTGKHFVLKKTYAIMAT